MATNDYQHGEMDISSQKRMWDGFLTFSTWGGLITVLIIAYSTFAIAMGMNWMVSLGITALIGFVAGALLNLGGKWFAAMIVLIGLAVFVQVCIILTGAVI